jgi:anti-sigma B factor antagonist
MELVIRTETYHDPNIGEIATLKLHGPIDQKSVQVFESTILELYRKGICRLILDLSETKYLNSTGLGLLINIAHKVNVVGGGIRLVNVAEKFKVLFDMLGLESCLPILASHKEALHSLGSGESSVATAVDAPPQPAAAEITAAAPSTAALAPSQPELAEAIEPNINAADFLMGASVVEEAETPAPVHHDELATETSNTATATPHQAENQVSDVETKENASANAIEIVDQPEETNPLRRLSQPQQPTPIHDKFLLRKTLSLKSKEEDASKIEAKEELPLDMQIEPVHEEVPNDSRPAPVKEEVEIHSIALMKDEVEPGIYVVKTPLKQERMVRESVKSPQRQRATIHIIKRKITARYYDQMNSNKTYPMALLFSLRALKEDGLHEPETEEPLKNPNVLVVPRFPGCQIVPERIVIDVSSSKAAVEFWVTPFTTNSPQGKIPGWIEIYYDSKVLDSVNVPFRTVRSTWAKIMGFLTLFFSILGLNVERFQEAWTTKIEENFPLLLQILQGFGGWRPFCFVAATLCLACTMWFVYRSREHESAPVEKASSLRMR